MASMSTKVVIIGEAISAGSSLTIFAKKGKEKPISFAITTVKNNVKETVNANKMSALNNHILKKLTKPSAKPTKIDTKNSL